jgi:hypothetical protein
MKRIVSISIVVLVFAWMVTIGILIVRQALTSGVSNEQLIANFIATNTTPTMAKN